MIKSSGTPPAENLKFYLAAVNSIEGAERFGKTTPYTSLNGNMYSFLSTDGVMGLRLALIDREEFIEKHSTILMEQHGHIMMEYVLVPQTVLLDTVELAIYFQKSYTYATTLRPKASKRKQVKK